MNTPIKETDIRRLFKFLDQNSGFDFLSANLINSKTIDRLNWKGFTKNKDRLISLLKIYQRLLRILPAGNRALLESLIAAGLHSAIQIASMPKSKFVQEYGELFGNDHELIENTYQKAVAIRSQLLLKHISKIQIAEPHTSESRLKLN